MEKCNPALTFWFATGTGVANWTPRTWRRLMLTLRRSCAVMQCTRLWLRSGKDEQSLLVYCRSSDSLNCIFKLSYHEIITRYNVLAIFLLLKRLTSVLLTIFFKMQNIKQTMMLLLLHKKRQAANPEKAVWWKLSLLKKWYLFSSRSMDVSHSLW